MTSPSPETTRLSEAPRGRRTVLGWIALVVAFAVFGTGIALVGAREWSERPALDPEGAGADGARAIARLLEEHGGIAVTIATSLDEALAAAGPDTTLAVGSTAPLDDAAVEDLVAAAGDAVLLAPTSRDLRILFSGAGFAGHGDGTAVDPACDLDAAARAGGVAPGEAYTRGGADIACYPVGDGFGLLRTETADGAVTAVDAGALLANAHLAEHGHAALGLGVLGGHGDVVWYLPGLDDAAGTAPATIGELTPGWVTPAIVLAVLAVVAAGVWRGRRFGPLVAEDLPVTVRASETLEGRARLYARAADPRHAAARLREGACARIAGRLGLPRTAAPVEVADAAAARLGAGRDAVREIVLTEPADDAAFSAFGERLRDLEAAVDAAVRTERKRP
ncbi:DUF4350 domain-containing protein [Microbacterium betulae]|uniref:DUF4350 domain-containing protein n=1 Tax=Microbacterium betulae TaxID=2981139 RepID=A0AA97FMM1_9MICO|nr:DUF4350 domain-containing protein [Microbacterium sp. AB]WOF24202.1 DUF4350 domain-containing protein [Microbacterium sp. AB]